ncbi:S66 peptidase family protein [Modestobacter sp. NPDC049651]|uniref:S66 family peptidase n=1 Tax=unclassified Modestobacter TaxID=2643866 RepID=UPI0034010D72
MTLRFPAPLVPGDRLGVTAPSSGLPDRLRPRLEFAVRRLRDAGFDVVLGDCLGEGDGVVSAPAADRAAELSALLTDPAVRAVVAPWGGELAVELLPHLDVAALTAADPTWLVGFSDLSTLLLPLTLRTGTATVHAEMLLDTPYRVPAPLRSWLDVVTAPPGGPVEQGATTRHLRGHGPSWVRRPRATRRRYRARGSWRTLRPGPVHASGRLLGGCLDTVSTLAGTPWGDVPAFAAAEAPEGLIVYLDVAEHAAYDAARDLWRLRLAGWFDAATAVLVGRTAAPGSPHLDQDDAVARVLGDLGVPVVLDVDLGHVPPQLALVNGARAELVVDGGERRLTQWLG